MNWMQLIVGEYWVLVGLFALVPLLTGALVYWVAVLPRFVRWFEPKDLATSYLGALTLPFALFLAFMMSDIWQRETKFALTVLQEVQRLDSLLDVARICGAPCQAVDDAVGAYARSLSQNEWDEGWTHPQAAVSARFETLVAAITEVERRADVAGHLRAAMLTGQGELRRLRTDRYFILHVDLAPHRWAVVLLLGVLSQIGLAALHVGKRPQLIIGLATFSIAFAVTLAYTVALAWPTVDENIIPREELTRVLAP
ncbi:DUF4239 domain-containing protein [Ancylobacter radicis]|uniref:DUF4239 domain-containing protein n=1 Tax=Ancylobacter radicis TaxID=2836179 RepID=A0ABS5R5D1_9HYPH|nr:DUF4239 domain-containing protein [Ancylobacter radicis]MBS9476417.1 DUF4239 domain-containing protein [Ancylobacter radicis]